MSSQEPPCVSDKGVSGTSNCHTSETKQSLLWRMLRQITVEPTVFLYMLSSYLQFPTFQALVYQKACIAKFNDSDFCAILYKNESLKKENDDLQAVTSTWILYTNIALTLPSIITVMFTGSWCDKIGHKFPIVLSCLGILMSNISNLLNAIYIDAAMPFILIGPLLNGMLGGFIGLIMASLSYVAYDSDGKSRTVRVAIVESMFSLAGTIGVFSSGIMLDSQGFVFVFSFILICVTLSLLYTLICVREILQRRHTRGQRTCAYLFSLNHIKESVMCFFMPRENRKRCQLWLLFAVIMIIMLCTEGQNNIMLLYVRKAPLYLSYTLYGYLNGLDIFLRGLVLLSLLPVLKRILSWQDTSIIILGLASRFSGFMFLAFASHIWMLFLAAVVSMMKGFPSTGARSLVSQLTSKEEHGKLFAVVASGESIVTLLSSSIFNNLYTATLSSFPGLSFIVLAVLCVCAVVIIIIVRVQQPTRHPDDYESIQDE